MSFRFSEKWFKKIKPLRRTSQVNLWSLYTPTPKKGVPEGQAWEELANSFPHLCPASDAGMEAEDAPTSFSLRNFLSR